MPAARHSSSGRSMAVSGALQVPALQMPACSTDGPSMARASTHTSEAMHLLVQLGCRT